MLFLILLHFVWYAVEIFNIDSISLLPALAATKIYIFPFFLLVMFRQNENNFNQATIQRVGTLIIFIVILECLLSLYQLQGIERHMLMISPHYEKALRGIFVLDKFRPFGTTYLPGVVSVYLFLSTGFIFLRPKYSKKYVVLIASVIALVFLTLLVCQVRSAMIKFALILASTIFTLLVNTEKRSGKLLRILAIILVLTPISLIYFSDRLQQAENTYINLDAGMQRWEGVESVSDLRKHRIDPFTAFEVAIKQLDKHPIGVGPGSTGAVGTIILDKLLTDPVYTQDQFWAYDNFYLSMLIEFGYGAIFYLLFIFCFPVILFRRYLSLYRSRNFVEARFVMLSLFHTIIILMGNWGAIGLPYNPESFFFWLWVAIGLNTHSLAKKAQLESEATA
ncbi:MAG TPA: hypothetical protein VNJ08_01865 [Bacteriovoracaceae bacterium]|nr:hypothetical protein [Bacteriovoracaceae bacterium]